jgi:hypothetical protein
VREKHRLKVFENRVLRRIFGPQREEDRSRRKLHNDELHNMYSSPNIVRVIKSRRTRWAGPLGRPRHRWEDNIKLEIKGAKWIKLAQDRVQW